MMNMLGAFNQFEREIIRERTRLGLARARANGRIGGGRYKLTPPQQKQAIDWGAHRRKDSGRGCRILQRGSIHNLTNDGRG
jgi:DNA invertase Pin-like site-specific DNA recombinase